LVTTGKETKVIENRLTQKRKVIENRLTQKRKAREIA
jgi:hypothetical protein